MHRIRPPTCHSVTASRDDALAWRRRDGTCTLNQPRNSAALALILSVSATQWRRTISLGSTRCERAVPFYLYFVTWDRTSEPRCRRCSGALVLAVLTDRVLRARRRVPGRLYSSCPPMARRASALLLRGAASNSRRVARRRGPSGPCFTPSSALGCANLLTRAARAEYRSIAQSWCPKLLRSPTLRGAALLQRARRLARPIAAAVCAAAVGARARAARGAPCGHAAAPALRRPQLRMHNCVGARRQPSAWDGQRAAHSTRGVRLATPTPLCTWRATTTRRGRDSAEPWARAAFLPSRRSRSAARRRART